MWIEVTCAVVGVISHAPTGYGRLGFDLPESFSNRLTRLTQPGVSRSVGAVVGIAGARNEDLTIWVLAGDHDVSVTCMRDWFWKDDLENMPLWLLGPEGRSEVLGTGKWLAPGLLPDELVLLPRAGHP